MYDPINLLQPQVSQTFGNHLTGEVIFDHADACLQ